jgi:hypothetical protein
VAFLEQGITEVRTDKTGPTGYENAHRPKSNAYNADKMRDNRENRRNSRL